jgi:histidinol-phosphate aminotransferase
MPYGHDLNAFRERLSERTRLVFIANPNNPTGTWLSSAELEDFIAAVSAQTLVVVDEAYVEYADAPDYASAVPWLEKYPNLVVCRTFSKAYGLAGLRVGYGLSHPAIADLLNRVRQPFNVNSLALAGALAALSDTDFIARSRAENSAGLLVLQELCRELGLDFLPSQANFLCIDFGRPAQPIFQALLQRGLIVRPVANYGLPHHLRITLGTEAENQALAAALREIITAPGK